MNKYGRVIYLIQKWNDPNEGATTSELKELRELLGQVSKDVVDAIALRLLEEE